MGYSPDGPYNCGIALENMGITYFNINVAKKLCYNTNSQFNNAQTKKQIKITALGVNVIVSKIYPL